MNRRVWFQCLVFCGLCIGAAFVGTAVYDLHNDAITVTHGNTSQNVLKYLPGGSDSTVGFVSQHEYLRHFFAPWRPDFNKILAFVKSGQLVMHANRLQDPGWGANANRHTQKWVQQLIDNSNLVKLPNLGMRAIVVRDTNVRTFPTNEPVFSNWLWFQDGYPFDRMQKYLLRIGVPVYISNVSKDGAWYYILTEHYAGWIASNDAAFVNDKFIADWKHSVYVTPLQDNVSLYGANRQFVTKANIGNIYPVYRETKSAYQILLPIYAANRYAQTKLVYLPKKYAARFPLPLSASNVGLIISKQLGQPFGLGGIYGQRDCSSTMMDTFAPFGIWLSRTSWTQMHGNGYFNLRGMNPDEKFKLIQQHGVPFFTLLHCPGHMGLYLGIKNGKICIFQNAWGAKKSLLNYLLQRSHPIVGKAVITALRSSRQHFYSPPVLLDQIEDMRVLVSTHKLPK